MTRTELRIPVYTPFTNADQEGIRGISVHIKETLQPVQKDVSKLTQFSEVVPVEIKLHGGDKLLIMGIYRSPNSR